MPSASDIINIIAPVSQFYAANDIQRQGLFGGGVDITLPRKLYCIRKNCQWLYDLDPTDDTLTGTSNYLYALCGKYALAAANATGVGAGSVAGVTTPAGDLPEPLDWEVSADSEPLADGESTVIITDFIGYNIEFTRGGVTQNTTNTGGSYYSWDRVTGTFTCYPGAVLSELFRILPTR